jgi:RNA polymerase sigma-70 factor (ECF subfamily)
MRTPFVPTPEGMDAEDLAVQDDGEAVTVEDAVAQRDLSRHVALAMRVLPEEQRSAVLLKEYHGLTFQEIAELQGCPLSTVKTRLYQGLSVLRRELGRRGVMDSRMVDERS